MKKLVQVQEVENEGMIALMDKAVMIFCVNYIYAGKLVGVNDSCILLESPKIVYETGEFGSKTFKDAQALPFQLYIQQTAIESFGETNKV